MNSHGKLVPYTKEDEENDKERIKKMKHKRMNLGQILLKVISNPIKDTRKAKKVGRRGQVVS